MFTTRPTASQKISYYPDCEGRTVFEFVHTVPDPTSEHPARETLKVRFCTVDPAGVLVHGAAGYYYKTAPTENYYYVSEKLHREEHSSTARVIKDYLAGHGARRKVTLSQANKCLQKHLHRPPPARPRRTPAGIPLTPELLEYWEKLYAEFYWRSPNELIMVSRPPGPDGCVLVAGLTITGIRGCLQGVGVVLPAIPGRAAETWHWQSPERDAPWPYPTRAEALGGYLKTLGVSGKPFTNLTQQITARKKIACPPEE